MDDRQFLKIFLYVPPIAIWSTTFLLAAIRVWRNNHRELDGEAKRMPIEIRAPPPRKHKKKSEATAKKVPTAAAQVA
ncbi:unnamed protein product [Caenorhabditis sp. 36 PRJEB53466]|nr:unnamed protein product [Caenorhabditis sp. 36 PRJEB53466]